MEGLEGVGGGEALYLYCFFLGPPSVPSEPGIDGAGRTVVLRHEDVYALASPVPLEEYGEEALNRRIEDLEWLTPRVQRHEEIVRTVMRSHPVVPVKFGTLFASAERLLGALREVSGKVASALAFVRDKEEWGLKVYASRKVGSAGEETARFRALNLRLSSATPGEAHLLRKQMERLVREERLQRLDVLSSDFYRETASMAVRSRRNPTLGAQATGRTDDMILNAAFLVKRSEVGAFREKLNALAANHAADGLTAALTGPWPPYNFCPDLEGDGLGGHP